MPDSPAERRRHLNRQDYAERFARGDSYGLLLSLLGVLYLVIALADHRSLWGRFFISVLLGAVLLLAFHTSHVRSRGLAIGVVLVVLADTSNLLQAVFGRQGSDGSTFIMFVLVLVAPVVDPQPDHPARDGRVGDHPRRRSASTCCIAIAFAGIYAGINDSEPTGFFAQQ